jgi:hypothetical protein
MKTKITMITAFCLSAFLSNSQTLLDLNENALKRVSAFKEIKDRKEDNLKDSAYPQLSFLTDMTTGSNAIGFRPSLLAATTIGNDYFSMDVSIKYTAVDKQQFNTFKTGQTLFVKEISNYSVNLGATVGIPRCSSKANTGDTVPRIGFNGSIHFRGNSLYSQDSTSYSTTKNDIMLFNACIGTEVIVMEDNISTYVNLNYMSVTNNRDVFHAYFPSDALKDYWYFQPGFRFRAIEGTQNYKNLIFDFSTILVSKKMKTIIGNQNTIIPVLKVGYIQKIGLKRVKKTNGDQYFV